ncbi:MAG TPA: hypothetical protein VF988_12915 [Verrucomicrobiae bacterium]
METTKKLIATGALATLTLGAQANIIFDNGSLYNGNQFILGNGQSIGNEVTLGSGIYLTNFMFEYYSPNLTLNASLGVDLRFYLPNGAPSGGNPTPGTLIYDSGWYYNNLAGSNIPGGSNDLSYASSDLYSSTLPGAHNLNTGLAGNLLPSDFIWVITFTNVGSDTIEIPLANTTTGANYGSYWLYDNGTSQWSLLTNTVPANFVSQFAGTVPEPSTFALGAIGGALLLGINKLRRKI